MKNLLLFILLFAVPSFGAPLPPPIEPPFIPWVPGPPGPTPTGPLVLTKNGQLSIPAAAAPFGAEIFRSDDGGASWASHANVAAGATLAVDMTKPSRLFVARIKQGPPVLTFTSLSGTIRGESTKRLREVKAVKSGVTKYGWQRRTHLTETNDKPRFDFAEFAFPALTPGTYSVTLTDFEGLATTKTAVVVSGFAPASLPAEPTPGQVVISSHVFRYDYWADRTIFPPNPAIQYNMTRGQLSRTSAKLYQFKYGPALYPDPQQCEAYYFGAGPDMYLQTWDGPCGQPSFYKHYPNVAEYSIYRDKTWGVADIEWDEMERVSASSAWGNVGPSQMLGELKEYLIRVTLYKVNDRWGDSIEFEGSPEWVIRSIGGYEGVTHEGWDTKVRIFLPANSVVDLTPEFVPLTRGWFQYLISITPL